MPEHDVTKAKQSDKVSRKNRPSGAASKSSPEKSKEPVASSIRETPFHPRPREHAALIRGVSSESERVQLISSLQRTYGNRYVQRLIKSINIQTKLTVGAANDPYEHEADRVAEQVMNMNNPASSKTASGSQSPAQREAAPEEEELQTKLSGTVGPISIHRQAEDELVQGKLNSGIHRQEEEEIQTKLLVQRQATPEEEEEKIQAKLLVQRQEEDEIQTKPSIQTQEEEEIQTKSLVQRQEPEPEEDLQTKSALQRQTSSEEEEAIQTKPTTNRQDEEIVQTERISRIEEEERVMLKPMIQRQTSEEEEIQTKSMLQRQVSPEEEEEKVQAKLSLQRQEEEEPLQGKFISRIQDEDRVLLTPSIQEQEMGNAVQKFPDEQAVDPSESFEAGNQVEKTLQAQRGGGSPLPDEVRSFMEPRFGSDFSNVRVHTGNEATQLSRDLSAQAFTHGHDIYMGEGKYSPGTVEGKRLLAHELTHVVQQTGSLQSKPDTLQRLAVVAGGQRLNLIKGTGALMDNIVDGMQAYFNVASDDAKKQEQISRLENVQDSIRIWFRRFNTNTYRYKGAQKGSLLQLNKVITAVLRNKRPKTGMAREEASKKFAESAVGIFKDWKKLKLDRRLQKLKDIANEQLKKATVFPVELIIDNKLKSGNAEFDYTTWSVKLARDYLIKNNLTKSEMASISDNVYHESRHAEQWFRIARLRAGEGLSAARLKSELYIPDKVASDAAGKPLKPLSAIGRFFRTKQAAERHDQSLKEAKMWAESVYGTNREYRGQVLNDIQNRYQEYRSLAEEEDAWSAGGKVNENVKNLLSQ